MTILLYGFAPFSHIAVNISQQVVEQFPEFPNLVKHIFRVRFNEEQFLKVVEKHQPDLIIGLGQYPRGKKIRIETLAHNSYRSNSHPSSRVIIPRAPTTLPLNYSQKDTTNSYLSDNPGRYVCNYSMYLFATWALSHNAKVNFLHLPKHIQVDKVITHLNELVKKS